MKRPYKHLAALGTLCCVGALTVLWSAVLSVDWVSIQEPQVDPLELDKLRPYEEPKPQLIKAKFGLFKMCLQISSPNAHRGDPPKCHDLDWYNFGPIKLRPSYRGPEMPSALIANCVEKLKFTLPFIGLSVVFTTASFVCLTFGHFCQKNKKIIEASMLILAGLCQATALLTFVTQIGSEFEANMPYSHRQQRLTSFYHYKYGSSFYLFLLAFSLSELAALFDMAAYFRKFPPRPSQYVITFRRQEPPDTAVSSSTQPPGPTLVPPPSQAQYLPQGHVQNHTLQYNHNNHTHHHLSQQRNNFHTLPTNNHLQHRYHQQAGASCALMNSGPMYKFQQHQHQHQHQHQQPNFMLQPPHPDICTDFNNEHIDLTIQARNATLDRHSRGSMATAVSYGMPPNNGPSNGIALLPPPPVVVTSSAHSAVSVAPPNSHSAHSCDPSLPPQAYISSEVTITTIDRNNVYGTIRAKNKQQPATSAMESFGAARKENNM